MNFFDDVRTRHAAELRALRPGPKRNFALAFVPPLGQYQNGERTKAWVIGGLFGAFVVTNVTTYFVLRSWCTRHRLEARARAIDDHYRRGAASSDRSTSLAGMGLILTYVYGVYDGVSSYRRQTREQAFVPYATPTNNGGVVGVVGRIVLTEVGGLQAMAGSPRCTIDRTLNCRRWPAV